MSAGGLIKYKRVAQRLREKGQDSFKIGELEDAIFIECGTDPRTVKAAIDRMIRLKLLVEIEKPREFGIPYKREFALPQTHNEYF